MTRNTLLDMLDVVGPVALLAAVFGACHLLGYDPLVIMQHVASGLSGWLSR